MLTLRRTLPLLLPLLLAAAPARAEPPVVNAALSEVDRVDARLIPLLECPELMLDADWMALLSYSTLLRVRHAASLYDGYPPHPARPHYWAGTPAHA